MDPGVPTLPPSASVSRMARRNSSIPDARTNGPERSRRWDSDLIEAYGDASSLGGPPGSAFYHDNWWVWDAERGVYAGVGMNGQCILVHRPARTVIAKLSTFPDALDEERFALHHAGLAALCESLVE